jgi:hypothetical protein
MSKFQVRFKLHPPAVAEVKTVEVEATKKSDAIVKAALKLDSEGIDRWDFVSAAEMTS